MTAIPSVDAKIFGLFHPFEIAGRWLEGLSGFRALAVCFIAGGLGALALPPFSYSIFILTYAAPLILLGTKRSLAMAFFIGWSFAFGYHVAGLYWISNALLVHGEKHAWIVPFAAAGLPAFLGVFGGATTLIVQKFSGGPYARSALFVAVWSLAEWLRGHMFTGFPWNLPAYAWDGSLEVLQSASLVGAYGLSLFTLIIAIAPFLFGAGDLPRRHRFFLLLALAAMITALWSFGAYRLSERSSSVHENVVIRVVQGNVPQREKWNPDAKPGHIKRYIGLSRAAAPTVRAENLANGAAPTHIIWPETAVAYFLNTQAGLIDLIASAVPKNGYILTGAPRHERENGDRITNSLFAVSRSGIVAAYDKFHLVPFGEYMPLRDYLPNIRIVNSLRDFSPGPGPQTLELPGLPGFSPLICYEVIFPGAVADRRNRPQFLLNATNDGWYGDSTGPHQHFAITRMRAIEEGLPIFRAANTGISGAIDQYGEVIAKLGLGETGSFDSAIPKTEMSGTVYTMLGDKIFFGFVIMLAALSWICTRFKGDS